MNGWMKFMSKVSQNWNAWCSIVAEILSRWGLTSARLPKPALKSATVKFVTVQGRRILKTIFENVGAVMCAHYTWLGQWEEVGRQGGEHVTLSLVPWMQFSNIKCIILGIRGMVTMHLLIKQLILARDKLKWVLKVILRMHARFHNLSNQNAKLDHRKTKMWASFWKFANESEYWIQFYFIPVWNSFLRGIPLQTESR